VFVTLKTTLPGRRPKIWCERLVRELHSASFAVVLSQVGFASTDAAGIVAVIDREPTPVNWLPSLADNF
jgi:hypothetical protein